MTPDFDSMGIHGQQVAAYITEKIGTDVVWTLETFQVADGQPDPNGIRNEARIASAFQGYTETPDQMPPITVIETAAGRLIHVDGWHRLGAAERAGLSTVSALIGRAA